MLDKLKFIGELLWKNNLARIVLSGLFLIVGGIMSPYGTIGQYIDYEKDMTGWDVLMYIGAASLVLHTLVFIIFAWIVNPIRDRKKK